MQLLSYAFTSMVYTEVLTRLILKLMNVAVSDQQVTLATGHAYSVVTRMRHG
jgi:hypothetical protein